MKIKKCGEPAFLLGVVLLGLATALMGKAGFGVSMVVAPAYVIADKLEFISTGTMCYVKQGILIVITSIVLGRFKLSYLFSFVSAVLFGLSVDLFGGMLAPIGNPGFGLRIVLFCVGIPINSFSIALLFRSYFPPQAPELFVKEISRKFGLKIHKTKYVFDLSFCALSIILSLLFFSQLRHIGLGTIIYAFINAPLIAFFGRFLDKIASFEPIFPKVAALFEKK